MSLEKVETLRAGFEAFNRGEEEAWIADFHDDADISDLEDMPDGRTYRGHEGARQWLANVRSVLGQMRFEPRRFREMGDTVLVEVAASGTGAGSGVPIAWTVFILFGFRSKKIATSRTLLNEQDAFDAAELPQEARCPSGARSSPGRCRRAAP